MASEGWRVSQLTYTINGRIDLDASRCGVIISLFKMKEETMVKLIDISSGEINGFKIIKDYGRSNKRRQVDVICKGCLKEFKTDISDLRRKKSCGCLPSSHHYSLPSEINGFKILKDLGREKGKTRKALVICKECNQEKIMDAYYLKNRKHCGCLRPEEMECSYRRSHPRLVQIFKCMRARCYYKKDNNFHNYGEKGIKICNEWLEKPDLLCEWSLKNGYNDNLSIDRIDNNKNYEPNNCKWSDSKDQARNRKGIKLSMDKARSIRRESLTESIEDLAVKYNVAIGTIKHVLAKTRWAE